MSKGKDLTEKGPGDVENRVNVPEWRGEDGQGGSPQSSEKEPSAVNYGK